jgi:hypothetical protein
LTLGARLTAGFKGSDNLPAFYHRVAAKKNVKLPEDGVEDFLLVKATAADKDEKSNRGRDYGKILKSGKTVQTAGEGWGGL